MMLTPKQSSLSSFMIGHVIQFFLFSIQLPWLVCPSHVPFRIWFWWFFFWIHGLPMVISVDLMLHLMCTWGRPFRHPCLNFSWYEDATRGSWCNVRSSIFLYAANILKKIHAHTKKKEVYASHKTWIGMNIGVLVFETNTMRNWGLNIEGGKMRVHTWLSTPK